MSSYHTVVVREEDHEDAMPRVIKVELTEKVAERVDWTPCFDLSAIGRGAYERRWFTDFRERWRKALRDERWNYRARLEQACTASK